MYKYIIYIYIINIKNIYIYIYVYIECIMHPPLQDVLIPARDKPLSDISFFGASGDCAFVGIYGEKDW